MYVPKTNDGDNNSLGASWIDSRFAAWLVGFAVCGFVAPIWTTGVFALATLTLALCVWSLARRVVAFGFAWIAVATCLTNASSSPSWAHSIGESMGTLVFFGLTFALPCAVVYLFAALVRHTARTHRSFALYAFARTVVVIPPLLLLVAVVVMRGDVVGLLMAPAMLGAGTAQGRSDYHLALLAVVFAPASVVFAVVWSTVASFSAVVASQPIASLRPHSV